MFSVLDFDIAMIHIQTGPESSFDDMRACSYSTDQTLPSMFRTISVSNRLKIIIAVRMTTTEAAHADPINNNRL